ncbi:chorismate synthase 2, chloroplastic [Spinacia oleracea]|uniref:chorismate synthase n=1 Tax=Spinacia oleracea TaxID=3562 RepID=A0ABM3RBU9_SPIOL|nr:chorismate synthase 2, chloroplastic-like [Spinacia oleracea]
MTYGESHGGGVGCVVDGVPPRLPLSEEDLQLDLDIRRPGQSRITTPRKETDTCKIISGISEGLTIGSPIVVNAPNTDQRGNKEMGTSSLLWIRDWGKGKDGRVLFFLPF